MAWLPLLLLIIVGCFSVVLLVGAPYLPTLTKQTELALDMLNLKKGETMLELGCGDGKVLLAAAARGWNVVGYELNPILALVAWLRTRRYHRQVRVVWGNFWQRDWPKAEGVYVFLLQKYMQKLDTKITLYPHKPVKLASIAFYIPDKMPAAEAVGVYVYRYDG